MLPQNPRFPATQRNSPEDIYPLFVCLYYMQLISKFQQEFLKNICLKSCMRAEHDDQYP